RPDTGPTGTCQFGVLAISEPADRSEPNGPRLIVLTGTVSLFTDAAVFFTVYYNYTTPACPAPSPTKTGASASADCPTFRLASFVEVSPDVPDCTDWPVRTYFFCNSQYDKPRDQAGFNFEHSSVGVRFQFSPNDLKGTIKLILRESLYG